MQWFATRRMHFRAKKQLHLDWVDDRDFLWPATCHSLPRLCMSAVKMASTGNTPKLVNKQQEFSSFDNLYFAGNSFAGQGLVS